MVRQGKIFAPFLTILLPWRPSVMQRHEIFVASSPILSPNPLKDGHELKLPTRFFPALRQPHRSMVYLYKMFVVLFSI